MKRKLNTYKKNKEQLKIKIKKLNDFAVVPVYATEGAAGMDMTAISKTYDDHGNIVYGTGIAMEIPEGYVGIVAPRSSNAKKGLVMGSSIGIIDSDYRGEITFKFKPLSKLFGEQMEDYNVGDRIGQITFLAYPKIEFEEVKELSETSRGKGGHGSTGK